MSSRNFIKFSVILFLTYLQISLLYTSNHTLWAGFDYDNHEYRYTVFIPHHNNSQIIISACQNNLCKVITESPYSRLTWIQFFEREFDIHFEKDTPEFYEELMKNFTSGFNITIENPQSYIGMIMGFCLFIIFV